MFDTNTLDNHYDNISFCVHPPLELAYAMLDVVHEKELLQLCKEFGIEPMPEILDTIHSMRGRLSKYVERELHYFAGTDLKHLLFVYIVHHAELQSVPELIEAIEATDDTSFIRHLISYAVRENSVKPETVCCPNDISGFQQTIMDASFKESRIKEKLLECLENPGEIKLRYCLLLKQFYEKAFLPFEDVILKHANSSMERYQRLFHVDPFKFTKEFLSMELSELKGRTVRIHVSWLEYAGSWYILTHQDLPSWFFLGALTDSVLGVDAVKERLLKLFKGLSDSKRLDIMILLGERPWYVQELAEQLDLTPATVSHHLTFLLALGVVTCERDEHRVYYTLDKPKVKSLFEEGLGLLVHSF